MTSLGSLILLTYVAKANGEWNVYAHGHSIQYALRLNLKGGEIKGKDRTRQDRTGQDSGEVVRVGEKWFLCNKVQLSVCCLLPTSSHEVL